MRFIETKNQFLNPYISIRPSFIRFSIFNFFLIPPPFFAFLLFFCSPTFFTVASRFLGKFPRISILDLKFSEDEGNIYKRVGIPFLAKFSNFHGILISNVEELKKIKFLKNGGRLWNVFDFSRNFHYNGNSLKN